MRHGQRARSGLKAARAPRRERHPRAARKCVFRVKEIEGERGELCPFPEKGWHHECDSSLICRADKGFFVCGRAETRPRRAAQFGIAAPPGIPAENLMAVRLREDAAPLHGTLVYPAAFGI